ncbi:MAG: hypothetical protein DIU83_05365, partial [Bacillota bacterium]
MPRNFASGRPRRGWSPAVRWPGACPGSKFALSSCRWPRRWPGSWRKAAWRCWKPARAQASR